MWVWLRASGGEGSEQVGVVEPVSPAWWDGGIESQGVCTLMALGTLGRWRKAQCAEQYLFLCEKEIRGKTHWRTPEPHVYIKHSSKVHQHCDGFVVSSCIVNNIKNVS